MSIDQIVIVFTGVVAVFLTQSKHESRRRYACIFGMLGQPAWFIAALSARQWGVLFVTFLYTAAWLRGVNAHWLQPWIARRRKPFTVFEVSEPFGATRHGTCASCCATCHCLTRTSYGLCCPACIRKLSRGIA